MKDLFFNLDKYITLRIYNYLISTEINILYNNYAYYVGSLMIKC